MENKEIKKLNFKIEDQRVEIERLNKDILHLKERDLDRENARLLDKMQDIKMESKEVEEVNKKLKTENEEMKEVLRDIERAAIRFN